MKLAESLHDLDGNKKYLVAVSGGVDSMVLLHLFFNSTYTFSVVHCNFQLRGEDSFLDEQLVREFCAVNNIELFVRIFDTLKVKKNNESVEMVARNLRYNYFKELIKEYKFNYLITAHHLNDNVETFFINLLRGSGLKGLAGMQKINGYILRPLLPFTREEIVNFATENKIKWREDLSNHTLDYLRNKIRHKIIPEFTDIHPDFIYQVEKSMKIICETQRFIEVKVNEFKSEVMITAEEGIPAFSLEKLARQEFLLVYHLLSSYGFTNKLDCKHILEASTGSAFESKTHRVWIDRGRLLVSDKCKTNFSEVSISIPSVPCEIKEPINLLMFANDDRNKYENGEIIDFDKVAFPLVLRNWKAGDVFYPVNGNGKKKVSKFLKDLKVSNYHKEKVLVLCDQSGAIIWVVGYRLDNRFKLSNKSNTYLHLLLR